MGMFDNKGLYVVIIGILMGLLAAMPIALADSEKDKQKHGIMPDSFLYGLNVALDNIKYLLTFNSDAKAKVGLQIAEKRLEEVREMIAQNKLEAAGRASHEHEKILAKVKAAISKHKGNSSRDNEELNEIEKDIEEHEREITEVRNNLTIKINAKGNITAEQQAVIDSVLKSLENQTGEVKIKINEKRNEISIKVKTGEEQDKEKREDKENKTKPHEEGKGSKAKEQIEIAAEAIIKARAELNASNTLSNSTAKLIAEAELHLSRARDAFEQGKFGEAFGQANAAEHLAINAQKLLEHKEVKEEEKEERTISGTVFEDINGNGIRNDNEHGLANWTVFLDTNNNSVIDSNEISATTDADGVYKFQKLAEGRYTIREVVQQGWASTTFNPVMVELDDEAHVEINFGNFKLGQIHGMKFNDINGDSAKDSNEPGLAGWTIFLDINNNGSLDAGEPSAVTDSSGIYSFTGLKAGSYLLREVLQQGWAQTRAPSQVTINSGTVSEHNDFGNFKLGEIHGVKFEDSNRNGIRESNETGLANWTIQLSGLVNASVLTDSTGSYSFVNLTPGIYTISEAQQAGWNQTLPNGTYELNITSGLVATDKNFGNFRVG